MSNIPRDSHVQSDRLLSLGLILILEIRAGRRKSTQFDDPDRLSGAAIG